MIEAISTIIPLIVSIILFVVILNTVKKKSGKLQQNKPAFQKTAAPVNMRVEKRNTPNMSLSQMEDKSHDWLAQQIAYERSVKSKMDDMFALRSEHSASCEAEMIKVGHNKRCDANGVDIGQY